MFVQIDVDVINEQKKILAELLKKRTPKDDKDKEKERLPEESKVEMFVNAGEGTLSRTTVVATSESSLPYLTSRICR